MVNDNLFDPVGFNSKYAIRNSKLPIPVSISSCPDYDPVRVRAALIMCLQPLGGMKAFVSPGDRVLLKPNLLSGKPPESAVCTHPEIVRAVAVEVAEAGGRLFLGDSPAVGSLYGVLRKSGIMDVVNALKVQLVPFRTSVRLPVPDGGVHRFMFLAGEATRFDLIINIPRFKTHGMMALTLAVKNMFGTVVGGAKPGWHLHAAQQSRFADMLIDVWRALPPRLNILDGITAMEGNGPGSGDPFHLGLLLASPSAIALDQVAGEIAGVPPRKHPVLWQARMRGIPGSEPAHIRVIGADVGEVARTFDLPSSISRIDYQLPVWLNRRLRKSLGTFPGLVKKKCTSCGQCTAVCPVDAITLYSNSRSGGIVNRGKCISCFCCHEICPEGAIELVPGRLLRILKTVNMA
jgi:uncharacterized protein (DUF362 family)/Pyruvate/2-oxoacid:ferredoxin oxidoreductase delta subunit